MKKRLISMALVAAMILTWVPFTAFATPGHIDTVEFSNTNDVPSKIKAKIIFQEPSGGLDNIAGTLFTAADEAIYIANNVDYQFVDTVQSSDNPIINDNNLGSFSGTDTFTEINLTDLVTANSKSFTANEDYVFYVYGYDNSAGVGRFTFSTDKNGKVIMPLAVVPTNPTDPSWQVGQTIDVAIAEITGGDGQYTLENPDNLPPKTSLVVDGNEVKIQGKLTEANASQTDITFDVKDGQSSSVTGVKVSLPQIDRGKPTIDTISDISYTGLSTAHNLPAAVIDDGYGVDITDKFDISYSGTGVTGTQISSSTAVSSTVVTVSATAKIPADAANYNTVTDVTFNVTIKDQAGYDVTVRSAGNGTVTPNTITAVAAGGTLPLTATPAPGFKFAGWTVVSGGGTITDNEYTASTDVPTGATNEPVTIEATFVLGDIDFTAATLPEAKVDVGYTTTSIVGSVGMSAGTNTTVVNYKYELASGSSLPNGLALDINGNITGTPTAVSYKQDHTFNVTVKAMDGTTEVTKKDFPVTLTLNEGDATTITVADDTAVYNGSTQEPTTVSVDTNKAGDITFDYKDATNTTPATPKNVGTYTVTASAAKIDGYVKPDDKTLTFEITRADLTIVPKAKVEATAGSALKVSQLIDETLTVLQGADKVTDVFTDTLSTVTGTNGEFEAQGVKVQFYTDNQYNTKETFTEFPKTAGTYYYTVEVPSVMDIGNYNLQVLQPVNGELTLKKKSSGGGEYTPNETVTYVVSYSAGKNGVLTGTTNEVVEAGKSPSKAPTVVPNEGYEFAGWSLDGTTTVSLSSVKVDKALTLTAVYKPTKAVTEFDKISKSPYITGYVENGESVFKPENNMSRGEVAAVLARSLATEMDKTKTYDVSMYTDMTGNEWYANYVGFLTELGVFQGTNTGAFDGERRITRAEFVATVIRVDGEQSGSNAYTDVSSSHWASNYISSAAAKNIVNGYPDGTFLPDASIKRAEVVKIINSVRNMTDEVTSKTTFVDVAETYWAYNDIIRASTIPV